MKHSIIIICLFFSAFSIQAQNQVAHLLDSLPTNFSYQVNADSFPEMKWRRDAASTAYFQGEKTIGCLKPVQSQPLFSISIGHPFLFKETDKFNFSPKKEGLSDFGITLYAVKKEHSQKDSLLMQALREYCTYGQRNYVTESDNFILFTYMYAINTEGIVRNFKKIGLWNKIEKHLIQNLNAGASYETKTQKPISINNSYHKKSIISGKFLWQSGGLPSRKIKTDNGETHISGSPATSHSYLRLSKNGKGRLIRNYHEKKSNHYKYKCRWYMDNTYIYVYTNDYELNILKIHNKNVLMHISEKYGFSRIVD